MATRRLPPGARVVLATHNAGKLRELEELLAPHGIALVSAGSLGLPEPVEDAADFVGNARLKALAAAAATGLPALADDSGLSVAVLGGAPGVVSARWAGPGKDFPGAMARVRREMQATGDADDRAWFSCALCLAWPDGATATFLGRSPGRIAWPPRGTAGFGYDPVFQPVGDTRTYGEMSADEKHRTNHRARAVAQLFAAILPLHPTLPGAEPRGVPGAEP